MGIMIDANTRIVTHKRRSDITRVIDSDVKTTIEGSLTALGITEPGRYRVGYLTPISNLVEARTIIVGRPDSELLTIVNIDW